jgi:hypothetical protein
MTVPLQHAQKTRPRAGRERVFTLWIHEVDNAEIFAPFFSPTLGDNAAGLENQRGTRN